MKAKYIMMKMLLICCLIPCTPEAQINCEWTSGIKTEISGAIRIESGGNWTNPGSLLPGLSKLELYGSNLQSLRQDAGSFYDLLISKSGSHVVLHSDIHISGGLIHVVQQDILLNGFMIVLDSTAGLQESPGHTITGPFGLVTTTRKISAPDNLNVAGMGLMISAGASLGTVLLKRGHHAQTANGYHGVSRYFDILPQFDHAIDFMKFFYDDSELNGNDEPSLQLYFSPDAGINWIRIESSVNTVLNTVEASGVLSFGRYTVSSHCLETCIATSANAKTTTLYLNAAGLAFLSPEQINDGSRGACGIDTMTVFPEVFGCSDVGVQQVTLTVTDNLGCSKVVITDVTIIDTIRPAMECKSYTLYLDESCQGTLLPAEIDNGSGDACGLSLSINQTSFDCGDIGTHQVTLSGIDVSGNEAECMATITVEMELPVVVCHDTFFDIGANATLVIHPFDLISGDPDDYTGYTFLSEPSSLNCNQLGEHLVTLTITDPLGVVTVCEVVVHLTGPDADCDNVSDACDYCHGGDDQADGDADGLPDCADWTGWNDLPGEWQCAANKVFVCHEGNVICVNQNAVQAHLDHGDFLGSCYAAECENSPVLLSSGIYDVETDEKNVLDHSTGMKANLLSMEQVVLQNFPNPFYPVTTIRFYLPHKDRISLSVFDITGRLVIELLDESQGAGWHEAIFDGSKYADGIYVYRLQVGQSRMAKYMILSKG